ncbi:MAG: hypothetical protein QM774_11270 [Gordonia sp. (in: high G+C Gram-positive bacteria)]
MSKKSSAVLAAVAASLAGIVFLAWRRFQDEVPPVSPTVPRIDDIQ